MERSDADDSHVYREQKMEAAKEKVEICMDTSEAEVTEVTGPYNSTGLVPVNGR